MNELPETNDLKKLYDAVQCIRKTVRCIVCQKLPKETKSAKCGHPFCKNCGDKILHTKKAVCPICKTVIIRSALRSVENIDKIVKDLSSLCEAIEKDSDTIIQLDKPQGNKQREEKGGSLELPGPSSMKTVIREDSSRSEISDKQSKRGKGSRGKKVYRKKSIGSEETIQLQNKIPAKKKSDELSTTMRSTSRATNVVSENVFTSDNLPIKIGAIGYKEKVEGWLNSEEFREDLEAEPDGLEPPDSSSTPLSEILESSSRVKQKLEESSRSRANSRASKKKPDKREESEESVNTSRFKSFTFEKTNKKKETVVKPVTPAERMFEELKRTTNKEQADGRKSRGLSVSAEDSWTELARLKKEAYPKLRKRKRLNVSIERPSSAKPMLESSNSDASEEYKESKNITDVEDRRNKSAESNKEASGSDKKKQKPALLSYRTLEPSEMIDLRNLNRRQVKEIIGVLDASKNSSNSPDKSSVKSYRTKLSLRRSGERSREEEATSRPQSRQSLNANDSRPASRLSCKSTGRPSTEKFKLSTGRRSSTPNKSVLDVSANSNPKQQREEEEDKIQLAADSPIRVCSDVMRNKLSLKRLPSSKAIDPEDNAAVEDLEELRKMRNKTSFFSLGSTRQKPEEERRTVTTCNAATQTIPFPIINTELTSSKHSNGVETRNAATQTSSLLASTELSPESMKRLIIPETRTVSLVSTDIEQMEGERLANSFSKSPMPRESPEELNTATKVNMLSPEKDSQLKFLATKSPSVPRLDSVKSSTVVRDVSSANLTIGTSGTEEYSKAVKKCAEALTLTDSDEQDILNESERIVKRKNDNDESDKAIASTTTSLASRTTLNISEARVSRKIEGVDKPPSLRSSGNNSGSNLSRGSPRRKRFSKDSLGSQAKRRGTEKIISPTKTSGSYCDDVIDSDAETVLIEKTKNKDGEQVQGDSENSLMNAKHRVVRKLKYSEESGSNPITGSARNESSEQRGNKERKNSNRTAEKKTFQRICRVSSSDSDELVISLATKQSSNNSQTIQRPGLSREVNKSPILSEDMTVIFSSNKDTQESKRKRSPSPRSLDNHDLQAIASNWCADLDRSSEEIVMDNEKVLVIDKKQSIDPAPPKKPRVEVHASPVSLHSDNFPVLSPTAIYGKRRKSKRVAGSTAETDDLCSSIEDSTLINDLDKAAAVFDQNDAVVDSQKNGANFVPINNSRRIDLAGNTECSIKRANTFSGIVTTTRNSTPIKAKSLEGRDLSLIHRHSQNSDKENELRSQAEIRRSDNKGVLSNIRQRIGSDEDFLELQTNSRSLEKSDSDKTAKSNSRNVSCKINSTSNTELFESSFDQDCLNITQEQILMREVEENLLGKRTKDTTEETSSPNKMRQKKEAPKFADENQEADLMSKEKPETSDVGRKAKGYQIAQIDSDDNSETIDDDIIERTPEKNLPSRKDLYTQPENSQRSSTSSKSFMSANMTPIPKPNEKQSEMIPELSMLSETITPALTTDYIVSKKPVGGPSGHSTPKSTVSVLQKTSRNQDRRLCFVCSCLSLQKVQIVKSFARKHDAEYTAVYKPEVTHVIVETDDSNSAGRTLKYLLGVAHKKWIVSFCWVTESLKQNQILNESDYEAVDSDDEPGPRRSRLSSRGLFEDFAFVIMKPLADITVDQLQDLLTSTGGTVVESLEKLAIVGKKYKLILYNGEVHKPAVLENWRRRSGALPVQMEWVPSCISQYELVSFRQYLHDTDAQLLPGLNFTGNLIADDEDSCSADEPSTSNIG